MTTSKTAEDEVGKVTGGVGQQPGGNEPNDHDPSHSNRDTKPEPEPSHEPTPEPSHGHDK